MHIGDAHCVRQRFCFKKLLSWILRSSLLLGLMPRETIAVLPLPTEDQQIEQMEKTFQHSILTAIDTLKDLPLEQKNEASLIRLWRALEIRLLSDLSIFHLLAHSPHPIKEKAAQGMQNLRHFLDKSLFENQALYASILRYARSADLHSWTSYDRYILDQILENAPDFGVTSDIAKIKKKLAKESKEPFLELKSKIGAKKNTDGNLSIFTLNICCSPGPYAYLNGVPMPWQERIEQIADKILEVDADIVCLQEVHEEAITLALYRKLGHCYSYFYGAIGPRVLGSSFQTIGLPSGLFMASKYPIKAPTFTLFSQRGFPMNTGFFDGIVMSEDRPLAHVYSTHMQALDYPGFKEIRSSELEEIVKKIEKDRTKDNSTIPYILCGDLNIPFGSKEPGEKIIQDYFLNHYNTGQEGNVTETNRTCTDYYANYQLSLYRNNLKNRDFWEEAHQNLDSERATIAERQGASENQNYDEKPTSPKTDSSGCFGITKEPSQIDPNFQILDYILIFRSTATTDCPFYAQTDLIRTNDLKSPETAITDHHGLLMTINLKQ